MGLIYHQEARGFAPLFGSHHEFYGAMEFFYMNSYVHNFSPGLQNLYAGGNVSPVKGLKINAAYHLLTITDADMYSRLRKASLAFFLMAIGIFVTIFLIAYSSVKNIWRLGEERLKNQHIEDELAIARKIQMSLVPSKIEGDGLISKLDISGFLQPARFVGGDLYDYYVRDNKLIFCIGDISGKGVPGAMLMSITHSLFRTLSAQSDRPEHIMQALNYAIGENNPDMMFITMFIGVMDMETGIVSYCNAGHNV